LALEFKELYNEETVKYLEVMRLMVNKGYPIDPEDPEAYDKEIEVHNNTVKLFTNKL